jgi:hypothetical protein
VQSLRDAGSGHSDRIYFNVASRSRISLPGDVIIPGMTEVRVVLTALPRRSGAIGHLHDVRPDAPTFLPIPREKNVQILRLLDMILS